MGTSDQERGDSYEAERAHYRVSALDKADEQPGASKDTQHVNDNRTDKEVWERKYAHRTLWLNAILAMTAVIGTVFIYYQVTMTGESNEAAIRAVNVASQANLNAALESKRNDAARKTEDGIAKDERTKRDIHEIAIRNATRESNAIARLSANAARQAIEISQRPYMTFASIESIALDVPEPRTNVTIENTGHSKALNVKRCFFGHVAGKGETPRIAEGRERCLTAQHYPFDAGPRMRFEGRARLGQVSEADRNAAISGEKNVFVFGWVCYGDEFGHRHEDFYCAMREPEGGGFHSCPEMTAPTDGACKQDKAR